MSAKIDKMWDKYTEAADSIYDELGDIHGDFGTTAGIGEEVKGVPEDYIPACDGANESSRLLRQQGAKRRGVRHGVLRVRSPV